MPEAGQFSDVAELNQDADLSQNDADSAGHGVAWQALHMAAAAACRGSTATGGSGSHVNAVLNRNSRGPKSCRQLCAESKFFTVCDAEVSVNGFEGKATKNGQLVGQFYNYKCNLGNSGWGGNEASAKDEDIVHFNEGAFSFCCCRKPALHPHYGK